MLSSFRTTVRVFQVIGRVTLFALAVLASGCASSFSGGVRSFEQARYPEALDELRAVQTDALRGSDVERVRYALYVGLTHLALGDEAAAQSWLARAKREVDDDPALLPASEVGRLASAWAHLPTAP